MPDSKELQNQLGIQQQINKLLNERAALMDAQAKKLTSQTQLAIQLCKALECKDLDQVAARLDEINSGLQDAASNAQAAADGQRDVAGAIDEAGGAADGTTKSFGEMVKEIKTADVAAASAASGIIKGFNSAKATLTMVVGTLSSMASGFMSVGTAIISMPFKMLGGLVDMATTGGGGVSALTQAMEKLRGEFGSLASNEGKAIMDGFDDLTSSTGALAQTGLSVSEVFGRGSAGMAAALEAVAEVARAAGAAFSMLSDSIAENAAMMVTMNKGLGMTNEALAEMTRKAQNAGEDVGDMLTATASMAIQMGDKFGVSSKIIGANMSALTEDVANFGNMSVKQLGATATYMAKLGLEAKDLQGVISKFDNFEDAAGSVSQLNQAFGMQLDTMEMMNAENPAERIDMMRDAFHEAGKSVEDMTRQEKALLAEQMGLSVSAMENALAAENQGVSYEDLEAGAEDAEENAMSQEEAMSKLADSIEKMTEGGGGGVEGFFDSFAKGFMKGLASSEEFQAVIQQIRDSLKVVFQFGEQLGKMFADLMGDLGVWDGLKDLFDPKDLRDLLGINEKGGLTGTGLLGIFKRFKDSLTGKGTYSPQNMAEDMGKEFEKFFGKKGPAMQKLKNALIKGIEMVGAFIAGMIPWIVGKFADMIKGIADYIRNPDAVKNAGEKGIGGALVEALSGIGSALIEAAPVLLDAILDLLSAVFEKHGDKILMVGGAMAAFVFGKMILTGALTAAKGALIKMATDKLIGLMGGVTDDAGRANQGNAKSTGDGIREGMGGLADGLKCFIEKVGGIDKKDIGKAAINLTLLAAAMIPAMILFAIGITLMAKILSSVPFMAVVAAVIALVGGIWATKFMVETANEMQEGQITKSIGKLLAAALMMTVGGAAFVVGLGVVGEVVSQVGFGKILAGTFGVILMAAAIFAMVPMIKAASKLNVTKKRTQNLVKAGALLVIGGSAFALGIGAVGVVVGEVGFGNIMKGLMGLVVMLLAVGATVLLIKASKPMQKAGSAIGPMLMGALFMLVGVVAFLGALWVASMIINSLDMGTIAMSMLFLLGIVLLTAAIGATALLFNLYAGMDTVGALLGALFVAVGLSVLGLAFQLFQSVYSSVDLPGVIVTMLQLTLAMLALVLLAGTSALVALMIPIMIVGGVGLIAAAAFTFVVSKTFAPALQELMSSMSGIDGKELMWIAIGMQMAMDAIIEMSISAKSLVKYLFPGMMKPIEAGFRVVKKMADAMLDSLVPALRIIADMPIGDPKLFILKINALLKVFDAVKQMGDLVYKIAMLDVLASSGGGESGAILEGAAGFINAIFGGAKELIFALVKMLSVMKEGDIAKLEAIGGVLAAIGNLIQAMQPPPGLMDAIADLAGGGFMRSGDPEGAASLMKTYGDMMGTIMGAVKEHIPPMIADILKINIGDNPEMARVKAEVIGAAVSAVAKLIEAVGSIAQMFMDRNASQQSGWFVKSGPSMGQTLSEMKPIFTSIFNMIKGNLPQIIKAVIEAVPDNIDAKAAEVKVKLVAMAMEAVAKFGESIGAIGELMPPTKTAGWFSAGKTLQESLGELMQMIARIVQAVKMHLPSLIEAVLSVKIANPDAAVKKLEVVGLAMDAVTKFADVIGSLEGSNFEGGASMAIANMMSAVKHLIYWDGYYDIGDVFEALADNTGTWDAALLTKFDLGIEALTKMVTFGEKINELSGYMAMFEGGGMAAAVTEMVAEVVASIEALNSIGEVSAAVALDNFASAIGTGDGSFTITNEPVNITLNVQVTMDANKVGKVLVDKSVMTTPLAAAGGE